MKFFLLVVIGVISVLDHGFSQCNTSLNLALGRPATASSVENAGLAASNAFDGNLLTRWGSAFTDTEYIYVDLGSDYPLCEVYLDWEAAYGKDFTIDISTDAITWTTAATITGNTSLTNTIAVSGTGRYVRMNGIARGTGYGYSIHEFQVYSADPNPVCPSINIALGKPATTS
ncbi:MAG TPA: discoidin domain-containing protein, partial [Puia sp.]